MTEITTKRFGISTYFTLVMTVIMGIAFADSFRMPFMAAVYPAFCAGLAFVLGIVQLIKDFTKGQSVDGALDVGRAESFSFAVRLKKAIRVFAWLIGLYLIIALLGFKLGMVSWLTAYLLVEDKSKWLKIVICCIGAVIVITAFQKLLEVWFPVGLLGDLLEDVEFMRWLF